MKALTVEIQDIPIICIELCENKAVEAGLENISIDGATPVYTGAYNLTPSFERQQLNTTGKKMMNDVSVNEIQVQEVTNPQGGLTLNI